MFDIYIFASERKHEAFVVVKRIPRERERQGAVFLLECGRFYEFPDLVQLITMR